MRNIILSGLILLSSITVFAQKTTVVSPNQKVSVGLYNTQNANMGNWYLKVMVTIPLGMENTKGRIVRLELTIM